MSAAQHLEVDSIGKQVVVIYPDRLIALMDRAASQSFTH